MSTNLKIKVVRSKKDLALALEIRTKVFNIEQKIKKEMDIDGKDKESIHFIALEDSKPVGCARLRFVDGKAKLERFCVLKRYRGCGYGKSILEFIMRYCTRKKINDLFFHSQYHAKGFYEKSGFDCQGKTFMEAGVKHIEMSKKF